MVLSLAPTCLSVPVHPTPMDYGGLAIHVKLSFCLGASFLDGPRPCLDHFLVLFTCASIKGNRVPMPSPVSGRRERKVSSTVP